MSNPPTCQIGIVADVQYADREPKLWYTNYSKKLIDPSKTRNYRQSYEKFKSYAEKSKTKPALDAFIQLGDLVDSSSRFLHNEEKTLPEVKTVETLKQIMETVNSFNSKIKINCVGNHDVRTFENCNDPTVTKNYTFEDATGCSSMHEFFKNIYFPNEKLEADCFAYERKVSEKITVLNIDTFDLSVYGREVNSEQYQTAEKILEENNPNESKSSTQFMDKPFEKRFVQWTGGVSEKQLNWLEKTLTKLDLEDKHVIIVTHCPIHPETISINNDRWLEVCLTWNYDRVLQILENHKCVQVCLTGHNHTGGRTVSKSGINFLGIKGLIENSGEGCFGVLKFYEENMYLEGYGACKSGYFNYRQ